MNEFCTNKKFVFMNKTDCMIRLQLFMILAAFFSGCTYNHSDQGKKIISASILPQKYFIEAVAGDKFLVNIMIPPGGTPETYEPTARQMKQLSESSIYMKIGHIPFEKVWLNNINEINPDVKVFDLSDGIDLISRGHSHESDEGISGIDPHIWSSPRNGAVIAKNIFSALCMEDPENKSYYSERLNKFLALLDSLDHKFQSYYNSKKNKSFLIFHPALAYFARDYNLEQISLEYEGKSPPPGYMRNIIETARKKNIRTIFIQKQFNDEPARAIAKEIGGQVVIIDPLDENWEEQIEYIAAQIALE